MASPSIGIASAPVWPGRAGSNGARHNDGSAGYVALDDTGARGNTATSNPAPGENRANGRNIGHQPEGCEEVHRPSPPLFFQPQAGNRSDEPVPPQGPPQQEDGLQGSPPPPVPPMSLVLQAEIAETAGGRDSVQVHRRGQPQSQADQYGPSSPPVQQAEFAITHAHEKAADRNAFGTKVRPDRRPTPWSLHPLAKRAYIGWSYLAD